MSTPWNQQFNRYVLLTVSEFLKETFKNKMIAKDQRVQTNKKSTKYSNWNMQIQIKLAKISNSNFASTCLYETSIKVY